MRVIICDDHRVFSDALSSLLIRAGHEVVACPTTPAEAVAELATRQVDVCLLDLNFPGMSGLESVTTVVRAVPEVAVVVLTSAPDRSILEQSLAAGARAVALKGDDFAEILRVCLAASASSRERTGASPGPDWSRSAQALTGGHSHSKHHLARFLTEREREVLARLVRGESTSALARSMGIRPSTARTHVDAVLTKLGAHTRLEAVAYAVREGLVDVAATANGESVLAG